MPQVIAGARQLTPFQQGDLSRLCGLYAILNAIQLALYPQELTPYQRQRLFLAAVTHLASKRRLRCVLGVGMEYDTWRGLAETLLAHVAGTFGVHLHLKRILRGPARTSRARTLNAIATATDQGHMVLAYFGGALDHYTVIQGHTGHRLLLFDSIGLRWIAVDGIGLGEDCGYRHWISQASTYALIRGP